MGTVNILDDILGADDDELDFDFAEAKSNHPEELVETRRDDQGGTKVGALETRGRPQTHLDSDSKKASDSAQGLSSRIKIVQVEEDNQTMDRTPRATLGQKARHESTSTAARPPASSDGHRMEPSVSIPRDTSKTPAREVRYRDDRGDSPSNSGKASDEKGHIHEPRANAPSGNKESKTGRSTETRDQRAQIREPSFSKGHADEDNPLFKDANNAHHEIRHPAPAIPREAAAPTLPLGVHPERLKAMGIEPGTPPVAAPVSQRASEFTLLREKSPVGRSASITDRLGPRVVDPADAGTLKRKRHEEEGLEVADNGGKDSRKRTEFASDAANGVLTSR
ncbi:hypothetical protein HDU86_001793 [Geranomyces michiganensis]|nr:hypothetical protein HDU86_001793 [Geranomyces michiganensis]